VSWGRELSWRSILETEKDLIEGGEGEGGCGRRGGE